MIDDRITTIGAYAFYNCTSLVSLTLPNSLTTIGAYAFYGCSTLTTITIPEKVTSIGNHAFYNNTHLEQIIFNATAVNDFTSGSYVFSQAGYSGSGTTVQIGKNVTKIPAYMFHQAGALERSRHSAAPAPGPALPAGPPPDRSCLYEAPHLSQSALPDWC